MNQKTNTKSQTSVPKNPPKLQPGRPSLYWYDQALKSCIAGFIGSVVLMMIIYLLPVGNPVRFPLMLVMVVIGCVIGISMFVGAVNIAKTDRRERKAGYTTLYDYHKRDLWQLDPDTGEVLRRPGEPIPKRRK